MQLNLQLVEFVNLVRAFLSGCRVWSRGGPNRSQNYLIRRKGHSQNRRKYCPVVSPKKGTGQGDPISSIIFTIYLERILEHLSDEDQGGLSVHGYKITNLRYADDIDLVSTSSEQLQ